MNDIEYTAANGLTFKGDIYHFKVTLSYSIDVEDIYKDFAEFGAFHAMHVHPKLNGFAGYDTLEFEWEK